MSGLSLMIGISINQNQIFSSGSPPVNTVSPSIAITSGGGYAGSTYTATPGTWDTGSPTGQWYSDGVAISGETATTYLLTFAKEGTVIKYRETNGGVTADSNTIEMWIPSDATGTLVAQFDIRRGITEASGLVSRWDGFAASEFLTQATGASQPLYSATGFDSDAPGMTFDGSDDYLEGLVIAQRPAARTLVFGIRIGGFGFNVNIVASNASGGFNFRYPAFAPRYPGVADNGVALRAAGTSAASTATTYFASCRFIPSGAYSFFRNGVAIGSGTASGGYSGTATSSLVGANFQGTSNYTNGVFASILMWDTAISDTDLRKAEAWVAWTIGKQAALDAGHTYKSAAPKN